MRRPGRRSARTRSARASRRWRCCRTRARATARRKTAATIASAATRAAAGARFLAIDDAHDAVIAAGGGVAAERIEAQRIAFAWRLPGVLSAAVLAFFLYLLVRRLFRS